MCQVCHTPGHRRGWELTLELILYFILFRNIKNKLISYCAKAIRYFKSTIFWRIEKKIERLCVLNK